MALDPSQLDGLRRNSGLAVDREGCVWHQGEPIAHPRLHALFQAGLDVDDRGEAIVRVGAQWAYVACERTPFVVTRARVDAARQRLHLTLNTGEAFDLKPAETFLRLEGDCDLYVRIHDGHHEARFGRTAWGSVADGFDVGPLGGVVLAVGKRRVPVTGARGGAEPVGWQAGVA